MSLSTKTTTGTRHAGNTTVIGILLLVLSGCSEAPFGINGGGSGASDADTSTTAPKDNDADADAETEEVLAKTLTGADCIIGTWLLDNASFAALMASVKAEVDVVDEVSGIVRFRAAADGSAVTEYIDWTHVFSVAGMEGVVTAVRNGEDLGSYTAEADGRITLSEHTTNSTMVTTATSGGNTITLPQVEKEPSPLYLGVFTCVGDELTVTVDDGSSIMRRES